MNKTKVVNIRKENYDVYIGRAGHGKMVISEIHSDLA